MLQKILTPARLFFALIVVAGLAGMTYAQVRLDVPYVPTPQDVVEKMLDMAKLTKDDYHIDLGSGDGRIAVTAAQARRALHGRRPQPDPHRRGQRERQEGRRSPTA